MTDYRALCEELIDALDGWHQAVFETEVSWVRPDETFLLDRARAALAEPEPEVVADGPAVQSREPASVIGEPSDEELLGIATDCFAPVMVHFARAVLARWGRPAPVPAEGEVADETRYLVKELRDQADDLSPSLELFGLIHRAADLLSQRHPVPVPVAERLPGPEDCDAEGRVWLYRPQTPILNPYWDLVKLDYIDIDPVMPTHWLPARALPLPSGEVEP